MTPPSGVGAHLCSGGSDDHPWRIGLAFGALSTELSYPGSTPNGNLAESSIMGSASWTKGNLGIEIGLGAILGGGISIQNDVYAINPGGLASIGASWRFLDGRGMAPFLIGDATLGASLTSTVRGSETPVSLFAADARVGALVGKTFFDAISPYLLARLFGGPILWARANGVATDAHHFQIGPGAAFHWSRLDATIEASVLGERMFVASIAYGL